MPWVTLFLSQLSDLNCSGALLTEKPIRNMSSICELPCFKPFSFSLFYVLRNDLLDLRASLTTVVWTVLIVSFAKSLYWTAWSYGRPVRDPSGPLRALGRWSSRVAVSLFLCDTVSLHSLPNFCHRKRLDPLPCVTVELLTPTC